MTTKTEICTDFPLRKIFANLNFGASPFETPLKFFERVREGSFLNLPMKLVRMRRDGGSEFIDSCLWPNYRIIKYIIINNYLNRDEKSKAEGVT